MSEKSFLLAYYSSSGNTKALAQNIHQIVGGEIFEIKPQKPYSKSFLSILLRSGLDLVTGNKTPLPSTTDISKYDVIFVGYPLWISNTPSPINTFLSDHNFAGKTVIPFCTTGGGKAGKSFGNVQKLAKGATVLDGLQVRAGNIAASKEAIEKWLIKVGIK
ncbi:MAG: flavodoxin [Elusimicrobiota bacterium]|jgi:flavodoxin|nr:flavodoxin [Elusimicrobiota bacterium]